MTIPVDAPSPSSGTEHPLEMESQTMEGTPCSVMEAEPVAPSADPSPTLPSAGAPDDQPLEEPEAPPPASIASSESALPSDDDDMVDCEMNAGAVSGPSSNDLAATKPSNDDDNHSKTSATLATVESSTEVVFREEILKRRRTLSWLNVLLMVLVPLSVALIVALVRVSHKQNNLHEATAAESSFASARTEGLTCGCTSCTKKALDTMTPAGTTCREQIDDMVARLGLEEIQACLLVGQQFPDDCGACDSSICDRHVGTCGCPDTCTEELLSANVTDQAGSYTCRARMQFMMDTRGMTESEACDFVSDEFDDVCGQGCRASTCAVPAGDDGTADDDQAPTGGDDYSLLQGNASNPENVQAAAFDSCPKLLWQDEFDSGALDTGNWNYEIGDGCDIGLCGWGNNEWESYQSDNVYVSDGNLVIEARNDNGVYTSGRITTKGLLDFQYGYVEASIQIAQGQGMWPAFWALSTDEVYGKWPQSGEIDIMENVGREPGAVHGTIHYGDAWPNNQNSGARMQLPNDGQFASSFHNYGVFWEEDRIRWFLDGAQYFDRTPDDITGYNWPFNNRFYLLLNLAIGGYWPGSPDSSTSFPQQMLVDYVRLYDRPFGRLTGPTVVNQTQSDAIYVLESGLSDYTYEWDVPSDAVITSDNPSGSASITVTFGTESGFVSVVATSNQCSTSKRFSMPVLVGAEYQYVPGETVVDCGCPTTCTSTVLDSMASDSVGSYSCRDRINWVMANRYLVEKTACEAVYNEFPSICTCNPSSCT